jgi:hypothetical protein
MRQGQPRNAARADEALQQRFPTHFLLPYSYAATEEKRSLPVENTHGNSQTHIVETSDHAALRIGGSFAVLLM